MLSNQDQQRKTWLVRSQVVVHNDDRECSKRLANPSALRGNRSRLTAVVAPIVLKVFDLE